MDSKAFALARATLRKAVKGYGWHRRDTYLRPPSYTYGPGKFEGEHWSIVHYYDAMMNGCGGEEFGTDDAAEWEVFTLDETECAAFGFTLGNLVALRYHNSGFVSMRELTQCEYKELQEDYAVPDEISCGQCEMLMINGVACHETGCPNMGARWDADDERWIKQYECDVCGYTLDVGTACTCNEQVEE